MPAGQAKRPTMKMSANGGNRKQAQCSLAARFNTAFPMVSDTEPLPRGQSRRRPILFTIPSFTGAGGTERMVANLARLLSADHEVHISSFDKPGAQPNFDPGVPFHALGSGPRLPFLLRVITYATEARRLRSLKRRLGVGLTISNLWRSDLISVLAGGSDRKIAICHINVAGNKTNALMMSLLPLVRAVYHRVDKVVAVNEALLHELKALYQLTDASVTSIDNFVDVSLPPAEWSAEGRRQLVWCGRFVAEKNVAALIDIYAGLRKRRSDAQLVLIGAGPLLEATKSRAAELGLRVGTTATDADADVVFRGSLMDPWPALRQASLMMLTSIAEGLPMVLLEAASLGIPIAASDCPSGGVASMILGAAHHDAKRQQSVRSPLGLLLPVPDPARPESIGVWVSELDALLSDAVALNGMRASALRRSRDYTPEAARLKWQPLIEELLGHTGAQCAAPRLLT